MANFLTRKQAAEKLGVSENTIIRLIKEGRLKANQITATQVRINEDDLANIKPVKPRTVTEEQRAKMRARFSKQRDTKAKKATPVKNSKPPKEEPAPV